MYGVVLWSDARANKAVFWCEDHGDLAYFHGDPDSLDLSETPFDAGDLVQFEVYQDAKLRKAFNPTIVKSKADADLPEKLMQHSNTTVRDTLGGDGLHFRPRNTPPAALRQRDLAQPV